MTYREIGELAGVSPATVSKVINNNGGNEVSKETRERVMQVVKKYDYKRYIQAIQSRSTLSGREIAEMIGVSPSTVSKIINNRDDSISKETRERVMQVLKGSNYKRNIHLNGFVGLMLPGSAENFSEYIAGASAAATAEGYHVVYCPCYDSGEEEKYLNYLFNQGVHGVAIYLDREVNLKRMFANAPEKRSYAVASNCKALSGQCAAYCAFSDAARMAAEHLIDLGHKEIALLGRRNHCLTADLISGYNEALYDHDILPRDESIFLCDSAEDVMSCVQQITCGSSTAFLCQDTQIAVYIYRVLRRYGCQIPDDYSIISLSHPNSSMEIFEPDITKVDVQFRELGQAVMESLIHGIEGRTKGLDTKNLTPQLWKGASVAPLQKSIGKRIVVVGSMNMDVILHATHLPTSGESLNSQRTLNLPGGKGANQAVGAAKLGSDVYAIGCLGDDQDGHLLYTSLMENGVNTTGVRFIHEKSTGKAYILVAENGESTIMRDNGANDKLQPAIVEANPDCFAEARFCLISTEIPWETVLYTIDFCNKNGIRTIVKPTVQRIIPPEVLKRISYLIPNEEELEVQVEGMQPVEEKAARLFAAGAENVIVTLGEKGCYLHNREMKRHFPAADFQAVDTTGAGDAFISAFAVYLSEDHDIVSAIQFATYAAGLSVTRDGVQPALADRVALEIYSDQYNSY